MKMFERVEIQANDDGTLQVEVWPVEKEHKDGEVMAGSTMKRKKYSATSIDDIPNVIRSCVKEKTDKNDFDRYMKGPKVKGEDSED